MSFLAFDPKEEPLQYTPYLYQKARMQIRVLSIHRDHELCWNAQQILHETGRKHVSAKMRTVDIFIFLVIIRSTVPKTCAWAHEISGIPDNILVTRASDLMAARDPRLWETLQEFSQNLAIWTSRRMLLKQTGN